MQPNTFLMMGRPGAGKGTQAKLLAKKLGARVFSTGDELRERAQQENFFGKKIKEVMDAGDLLPGWLGGFLYTQTLVSLEPQDKIVFEGACRTEPEAVRFAEISDWLERRFVAVNLMAGAEHLRERLIKRAAVEGRSDDAEAVIVERFREYEEKKAPAVEFFRSKGKLVEVNGEQSIEQVHAEVCKELGI